MMHLDWQIKDNQLHLCGDLNEQSLLSLWQQRNSLANQNIHRINVEKLSRIDSAGLACIINLTFNVLQQERLRLDGISSELMMLLELYNLRQLLNE